jgi:hypothetical protein
MAQFRRRHPEVDVPWSSGPALARVHELVAAEASKRPVFVMPDLFAKDATLSQWPHLPHGLLFQVWPAGAGPEARPIASTEPEARSPSDSDRAALSDPIRTAFARSARWLAEGRCEGCASSPLVEPRPSQEVQLVRIYEVALINHARAVRPWGADPDLQRALEARAQALSRLVGVRGP